MDGKAVDPMNIPIADDGKAHVIAIVLAKPGGPNATGWTAAAEQATR